MEVPIDTPHAFEEADGRNSEKYPAVARDLGADLHTCVGTMGYWMSANDTILRHVLRVQWLHDSGTASKTTSNFFSEDQRGSLSWNNNPTVHQFDFLFGRFFVHVGVEPDSSGKCLNFASASDDDFDMIDHFSTPDVYYDSDYVQNVVVYIWWLCCEKVTKRYLKE